MSWFRRRRGAPDAEAPSSTPQSPPPSTPAPAAGELAVLESAVSAPAAPEPSVLQPAPTSATATAVLERPPAALLERAPVEVPAEHEPAANGLEGPARGQAPVNGLSSPAQAGRSVRRIGEVVVDLGFADRQAVEQAVAAARSQRKPTGQVLVEQGVLRQDQLARVVAERFGLDYIDLSVYEPDMGAVNLLSAEAIKRYQAVPVR